VLELDVNRTEDLEALTATLSERWGTVDGALHAIAFAPQDALVVNAAALAPLMPAGSGLVGLDFDASVAWPIYDWMGVAKAALESVNRYLARDLGPAGIRSNLVSAGPIGTVAAQGIPGFETLAELWRRQAPLGWDVTDAVPVARAACWLLSDYAQGISGEIVHVDGGFHAVGAPGQI
jgi:enoyl ACP reductase